MQIDKIIAEATAKAVNTLYGTDLAADKVQVQATRKEFEGNFTVVVFPFLRASRKSPEETAAEIGGRLVEDEPAVQKFNVAKGFLNISVDPAFWAGVLIDIAGRQDWGFKAPSEQSELYMVEYSSPNTNKPLHLGHVRNNLLGYSVAQILKANGYRVVKTNIVN